MKVYVAGLGNEIKWKKLQTDEIPDCTLINNLEEEVLDFVGTVRSDKAGGPTGRIGFIMTAQEFTLVPGVVNPLFTQSAHRGAADWYNPTACTTIQHHTKRRCEHEHCLHVFKMEQMIDTQIKKKHMISGIEKDIYVGLKQPRIGYTNITTSRSFEYLNTEYREDIETTKQGTRRL